MIGALALALLLQAPGGSDSNLTGVWSAVSGMPGGQRRETLYELKAEGALSEKVEPHGIAMLRVAR